MPRTELEEAVIASLRKTFSAESFREHQRRVAEDRRLKASRQAQRGDLTAEVPKLQAKAARLAKAVADLDDTGELLKEYQAVQAQLKDAKDQLAYLDKADDQSAVHLSDAAALEAPWSDWIAQAQKDAGVARQMLRKALATPIAVRPTGKGIWTFAGFTKLDEVLAGGVGKRAVLSLLRDNGTASAMIEQLTRVLDSHAAEALAAAGLPKDMKVKLVLREDDDPDGDGGGGGTNGFHPISGGSDAFIGGSEVRDSEMAPSPQSSERPG